MVGSLGVMLERRERKVDKSGRRGGGEEGSGVGRWRARLGAVLERGREIIVRKPGTWCVEEDDV